jgi:hypothetical protein
MTPTLSPRRAGRGRRGAERAARSDAIAHYTTDDWTPGRLDPGVEMIQKPLTQPALAAKARGVLDRAAA